MEKFAITGELLLSADIKSTIDNIKAQIKKSSVSLPVDATISTASIKEIYKEINSLSRSVKQQPISLKVSFSGDIQKDVKSVLKEANALKRSLSKPIISTIRIDNELLRKDIKQSYALLNVLKKSLQSDLKVKVLIDIPGLQSSVKSVYTELKGLQKSLGAKPILGKALLDIPAFQSSIKTIYNELRGLKGSFAQVFQLNTNIDKTSLQGFVNLLSNVKSKNLSININLKQDVITRLAALTQELNVLDTAI